MNKVLLILCMHFDANAYHMTNNMVIFIEFTTLYSIIGIELFQIILKLHIKFVNKESINFIIL